MTGVIICYYEQKIIFFGGYSRSTLGEWITGRRGGPTHPLGGGVAFCRMGPTHPLRRGSLLQYVRDQPTPLGGGVGVGGVPVDGGTDPRIKLESRNINRWFGLTYYEFILRIIRIRSHPRQGTGTRFSVSDTTNKDKKITFKKKSTSPKQASSNRGCEVATGRGSCRGTNACW
jgi:hypothetical protein